MHLTQLGEEDLDAVVTCINIAFSETMAIFNSWGDVKDGLCRCPHSADFPETAGGVPTTGEDRNVGISDKHG